MNGSQNTSRTAVQPATKIDLNISQPHTGDGRGLIVGPATTRAPGASVFFSKGRAGLDDVRPGLHPTKARLAALPIAKYYATRTVLRPHSEAVRLSR